MPKGKRNKAPAENVNLLVAKYTIPALVLGIVEGFVTYQFLVTSAGCGAVYAFLGNPIGLIPYIAAMAVLAVVALQLMLINTDSIHASIFVVFLLVWLVVGFGVFYSFAPSLICT